MGRSRYHRIVLFFARWILSFAYWDILLPKIWLGQIASSNRSARLKKIGIEFRNLAVQMGGVLIKVGQFLSTRVDVLPIEITDTLAGLQDEVPPVDFPAIRQVLESEFDCQIAEKFEFFDESPLAAASLGQAHRATIRTTGDPPVSLDTVVKVQRPGIEELIKIDLSALDTVGSWLRRYKPIQTRVDVLALLAEFRRILFEEIDYLAEGRNAETFAEHFKDYKGVRVPKVYWSHTTKRVLTLENVLGIKITEYAAISEAGVDRAEVASRLLDTYLLQIFENGFFHADPHPGNLFVRPVMSHNNHEKTEWELTFVDFGMVGRIPAALRAGLRELLIGVGTKDTGRVVHAYQMLGVLLPTADLDGIEKAGAKVFERFWGKNMTELTSISIDEIVEFTDEFRELIYELPFQVPHNLIFLARCVGILSGICTGLDPQFNLWDHLAPYANKMITGEAGRSLSEWFSELGIFARSIIEVPPRMNTVLEKLERGDLAVRTPDLNRQVQRLGAAVRQLAAAILFAVFFLAGLQLFLNNYLITGTGLLICSMGAFLWFFYSVHKGK